MRDKELYRQLLGLSAPWLVARVELNVAQQRVDVFVEHQERAAWPCPACSVESPLYDHEEERVWRHLDSCQFRTMLHGRVPRIRCAQHGVRQVRVPWAEPRSRFTVLFERLAIDVLLETDVKAGAQLLGLSWDEAHGLKARAVERGLQRRGKEAPKLLGVDEKAIGHGQQYATVLTDLERKSVVDVAPGRSKEALFECLKDFQVRQLAQVQAVAMDMAKPYIAGIKEFIPGGADKIVFDRYHIMAQLSGAVAQVRRQEQVRLRAQGDDRLTGSRYFWLYGAENVPEHYEKDFGELRTSTLKTARAWAIKELLRDLWNSPTLEAAKAYAKKWYYWASHSRLDPIKQVAAMFKRHLPNILTYFAHPITNAATEGLNSTLQLLKHRARGFRNFVHFRIAVLFHCGKLDLHPTVHPIPG